ncbi:hypothetical protein BLNAU_2398 [Blattamonas nauphoetae]|uniref:Uncharacterized protein n=1 Tax=Blattamonas nauphoetae TaxID=2049346 RepID=A0ABQ9YFN6_9EUKA|nr:hypothetical protein BLNAU_2398 [Blattamonas nauphoetae]
MSDSKRIVPRVVLIIFDLLLALGGIACIILGCIFVKTLPLAVASIILGIIVVVITAIEIISAFLPPKNKVSSVLLWVTSILTVITFFAAFIISVAAFEAKGFYLSILGTEPGLKYYTTFWKKEECFQQPNMKCINSILKDTQNLMIWIPICSLAIAGLLVIGTLFSYCIKGTKFMAGTTLSQTSLVSFVLGGLILTVAVILTINVKLIAQLRGVVVVIYVAGGVVILSGILGLLGSCFKGICLHVIIITIDAIIGFVFGLAGSLLAFNSINIASTALNTPSIYSMFTQTFNTIARMTEKVDISEYIMTLVAGLCLSLGSLCYLMLFFCVLCIIMCAVQMHLGRKPKGTGDETHPLLGSTNSSTDAYYN